MSLQLYPVQISDVVFDSALDANELKSPLDGIKLLDSDEPLKLAELPVVLESVVDEVFDSVIDGLWVCVYVLVGVGVWAEVEFHDSLLDEVGLLDADVLLDVVELIVLDSVVVEV